MNRNKPILAVVVPCYNEEEIIESTLKRLQDKIARMIEVELIDKKSFICFVDDGSNDNTWDIIKNSICPPPP